MQPEGIVDLPLSLGLQGSWCSMNRARGGRAGSKRDGGQEYHTAGIRERGKGVYSCRAWPFEEGGRFGEMFRMACDL